MDDLGMFLPSSKWLSPPIGRQKINLLEGEPRHKGRQQLTVRVV